MNKDKALEELFLAQKPHFDDSDAFMASLTKRLDAVEFIKQPSIATRWRWWSPLWQASSVVLSAWSSFFPRLLMFLSSLSVSNSSFFSGLAKTPA